AIEPIRLPHGEAGNIFRGVLGAILHRIDSGAYQSLFTPSGSSGPSGLAERPRPFVLRLRHLEGRSISVGESLDPVLHLFDLRGDWIPVLSQAFAEMGRGGIGPGRGRAQLERVEVPTDPVRLPLAGPAGGAHRVRVEFLSPTELKPVNRPD